MESGCSGQYPGNPQLNLMHAEYYAGVGKYDFANLVLPLKDNKRTIGLTLLRFAVDDIPILSFWFSRTGRSTLTILLPSLLRIMLLSFPWHRRGISEVRL